MPLWRNAIPYHSGGTQFYATLAERNSMPLWRNPIPCHSGGTQLHATLAEPNSMPLWRNPTPCHSGGTQFLDIHQQMTNTTDIATRQTQVYMYADNKTTVHTYKAGHTATLHPQTINIQVSFKRTSEGHEATSIDMDCYLIWNICYNWMP